MVTNKDKNSIDGEIDSSDRFILGVCMAGNTESIKPADAQKASKAPIWQGVIAYFGRALEVVGAISKMGCVKHNNGKMPTKWREYPVEVYSDALARHIMEEGKGYLYDSESHMLHAGHAAWNALARLEKLLETHPLVEVPYAENTNSEGSCIPVEVERKSSIRNHEGPPPKWGYKK